MNTNPERLLALAEAEDGRPITAGNPENLVPSPASATFTRYPHLERLGHSEVQGILEGEVHVFPKLDGTNASVWWDEERGMVRCGSRNREVTLEQDNHGFAAFVYGPAAPSFALRDWVKANPNWTIYGEWLVPHTIKNYVPEAWRRFYVFDVLDRTTGQFVDVRDYASAAPIGVDFLFPLVSTKGTLTSEKLLELVEANTFLMATGAGPGEGIVLKNYGWSNRHGRQTWAKLVRDTFRPNATLGLKNLAVGTSVEDQIVSKFVTQHLVDKTRAKVVADVAEAKKIRLVVTVEEKDGDSAATPAMIEAQFRAKVIPQLLGRVYCDLVREEIWEIIREFGNPVVDFGALNRKTIARTKILAGDLFA